MKGQDCTYLTMTVSCDCQESYSFNVDSDDPNMMRKSLSRPNPETVEEFLESEGWKFDEDKAVWVCDRCLKPEPDYENAKFLGYCKRCTCAVYDYHDYWGWPNTDTLKHKNCS